jgi:parallel beta-helix repeat protein
VLDSLGANHNLITRNDIGEDTLGVAFANGSSGIHLIGDSGGTGDAPNDNTIRLNTIASNTAQGILIDVGQRNTIRKNSINVNGNLGIDLGAVGPADPQSDDGGLHPLDEANRSQNFPVLTSAAGDKALGSVAGTLLTTAGDYTVDFYLSATCDTSGYGEGAFWLGSTTVTVPAPGSFNAQVRQPSDSVLLFGGSKITATATDSLGNTSEFSPYVTYDDNGIFGNGFDPPPA